MDGIMEQVAGAPRTQPDWSYNNPRQAALDLANYAFMLWHNLGLQAGKAKK
jgi:hypothetical protein